METDRLIKDILEKDTIAVYGMSTNPGKPAHSVPLFLQSKGYTIIPIHPAVKTIAGCRCYSNLRDIEQRVDILEVFRPSDQALDIVKEAIERRKEKGDIDIIWLQLGIENKEAQHMAEKEGITFIQNRCMKMEYHRLHVK